MTTPPEPATTKIPDFASISQAAERMSRWKSQRIVNWFAVIGGLLGTSCLIMRITGHY